MKKALALLLSLCMLLSCAAYAEGFQAHVTVSSMGQTKYDITAQALTDEDGCLQLVLDGIADGEKLEAFVQIGTAALVLGSGGEYAEIDYESLMAALEKVIPETLSDEEKVFLGIIYYALTDMDDDMAILGDVLDGEVTRLMNVGMAQGVITYGKGGTITFEADQDQLFELVKAYLASLSEDAQVFSAISKTQAWNKLGLSEEGVEEQAALQQLAASLAEAEFPGSFTLYIKAVIGAMDGTAELTVNYADESGTNLAAEAAYDGTTITFALDGQAVVEEQLLDIDYDYAIGFENNVCTIASTYSIKSEEINLDGKANARYDLNAFEFAGDAEANMNVLGTAVIVKENFSLDKINGLSVSMETTMDDVLNAFYLDGNAQQTEYGIVIYLNADAVVDNQPIEKLFNLDIVITDVVTIHSELNSYKTYDDDPYYSEYSNTYSFISSDILFGFDWEYLTAEEYALIKDTLVSGEYNVYTFDATLDLNSYKLDAALTAGNETVEIDGGVNGGAYDLAVSYNGNTILTGELELLQGMPFIYSLLMGKLTVALYDGTTIVRETKMDEAAVAWVFTVTDAQGTETQYEIGVRNLSDDDTQQYELYMASAGIEYRIGFAYEESDMREFAELYIEMENGRNVISYADITCELTMLTETAAHVSGTPIPQETLEEMIRNLLSSKDEIIDALL